MLKWLKRIGLSLLVIIALLAVWIHIGSIDQESFDDRGLLSELKPVPDAENGFLDIAYMGDEKFSISGEESLKDFSRGETWDSGKVEAMLLANKGVIDSIIISNKKSLFMLPYIKGDPYKLFSYEKLYGAARLLIIESRFYANNLEYDKSIDAIKQALIFSEHVKKDGNGYLISWVIGFSIQSEAMAWAHELITAHELSIYQYNELMLVLNAVSPYKKDGFKKIFSGEFRFAADIFNNSKEKSKKERFSFYKEIIESPYADDKKLSNSEKLYTLLNIVFPEYYVHYNKISEANAISMNNIQSQTENFCQSLIVNYENKDSDDFGIIIKNPGLHDFLSPNSLGEHWPETGPIYYSYFQRRCFFHVYVDAVRAAVAIKAYEKQHNGTLPETLDALVPDYLDKLPIDYFNGETLRYSPEKQWLYSVGADYKDDGGSVEGFYQGRCPSDKEACFNNPTIPLTAPQATQ